MPPKDLSGLGVLTDGAAEVDGNVTMVDDAVLIDDMRDAEISVK